MDINKIWVFDVSDMNNKKFNAKKGVEVHESLYNPSLAR